MKKIVCFIIPICLLLSSLICLAEEAFYPGIYYVGRDLKAGDYSLSLYGDDDVWVSVDIYASESDYKEREIPIVFTEFRKEGFHLSVNDGMVVVLDVIGNGKLSIITKKPSWKP